METGRGDMVAGTIQHMSSEGKRREGLLSSVPVFFSTLGNVSGHADLTSASVA